MWRLHRRSVDPCAPLTGCGSNGSATQLRLLGAGRRSPLLCSWLSREVAGRWVGRLVLVVRSHMGMTSSLCAWKSPNRGVRSRVVFGWLWVTLGDGPDAESQPHRDGDR